MGKIMDCLQSGRRWGLADLAVRTFGLACLAGSAEAALTLHRLAGHSPSHENSIADYFLALLVFLGLSAGLACLAHGQGLFERIEVPARWRRFNS